MSHSLRRKVGAGKLNAKAVQLAKVNVKQDNVRSCLRAFALVWRLK